MNLIKTLLVLFLFLLIGTLPLAACSMYKITVEGQTLVGCNHDAWFSTPKIWFEVANAPNEYGAAFTGAREVDAKRTAPQSGMNEAGLSFSRLVAFHPQEENPFTNRLQIKDEVSYLSGILHQCATVREVKKYIEEYDHSFFMEDVFIYIDRSGNYLIVEPYSLTEGNDPNYVLANFCPSITDNQQKRKLERYRHGEDYLALHPAQATTNYCKTLSDTMHVCRSRNGDGTLLSSIWNTRDGAVQLYFYHRYDTAITFNLVDELAKGNHQLSIEALFPVNPEFERLKTYKTPFNTPQIKTGFVFIAFLLGLFSFLFLLQLLRRKIKGISIRIILPLLILNALLIPYLFVLATHASIFYMDAPYQHYSSLLISLSSYLPFVILLACLFLIPFTFRKVLRGKSKPGLKTLFILNNLVYLTLVMGFAYWGLYQFWT